MTDKKPSPSQDTRLPTEREVQEFQNAVADFGYGAQQLYQTLEEAVEDAQKVFVGDR